MTTPTDDAAGLAACPHCHDSLRSVYEDEVSSLWRVGCGACGSHSGLCKTRDEAVALWNRRPTPPAPAGDGDAELRRALELIAIVDQGAGGTLTWEEMAKSAMRQARAALARLAQPPAERAIRACFAQPPGEPCSHIFNVNAARISREPYCIRCGAARRDGDG